MKKTVSFILALVMLCLSLPATAAAGDAEKMQSVLLLVKEKINIPDELSEFSGDIYKYDEKENYHFEWATADYERSISVSADSQGRITSYYNNTFKTSTKKISAISKDELISYAQEFLKKTVPEAFASESDRLIYNEASYYASGNLRYYLEFQRKKDGVSVKDNYASITLCVVDEEIYVRNMNISFMYDAEFSAVDSELEDYVQKYMELFPAELVYQEEYKPLAKAGELKNAPQLIYRIKDNNIGYMDISTGEELVEDEYDNCYTKEFAVEDSAENLRGQEAGGSLSPKETAELGKIEGLLGADEIESRLKKLPYIDMSDKPEMQSAGLYKENPDKYFYSIRYSSEDDSKYLSVRADAETGELVNLYEFAGDNSEDAELTEKETKSAEKKISEFLSLVAKEKLAMTEEEPITCFGGTVSKYFVRIANGVKYVDNGIQISFDAKKNLVTSYNLNFTEAELADPKDAISQSEAYEKILEYSPIAPIYIMSGGSYKKAVSLEKRTVIVDAILGEIKNKEPENEYQYSDIDGHWAKDAAEKLAQIQIGISGGKLEPDRQMTQEEFLRLAASAVVGRYYGNEETEKFYEMLIRDGFVLEEEKAPDSEIKREDAFVFTIRMAGYERVAKLSGIYKVSYADGSRLSDGKIGYAAILSGFGVISGNGGNLRPQDTLTRAEAMVMIYKYLLSL